MSKSPRIDPTQPVRLVPVHIAKPWGQEIWYTGMEERGESAVSVSGTNMPLSEYLAHSAGLLANHAPVLLLKILDPKPEPVLGELYFEVHEEKQEVYIVTHVDAQAWPGGVGGIRFGMDQDKRRTFGDAHLFRAAFLEAVQAYEAIRRRIDEQGALDLTDDEAQARAHMNSFTALRELRVGDVVKVPTWTPHALLHGVRVVEFQTQTYERFIISFAQQVVTQNHWDSQHAIARMHVDAPAPEDFEAVQAGVERIASFSDFNVWRVDFAETSAPLRLPDTVPYAVCMCLTGSVEIGDERYLPEEACFIPFSGLPTTRIAGSGKLLVAAPSL
ncbi:MAG: hypothetical protein ACFHXK_03090 [bacterium]